MTAFTIHNHLLKNNLLMDSVLFADDAKLIEEKIEYESLSENLSRLLDDCTHGAERISGIVKNLRIFSRLDEAGITRTDFSIRLPMENHRLRDYPTKINQGDQL